MISLISQFDKIKSPRILIFGDLILDRYTFGNAERVSPEAPVLVLRADAHEVRLGGAASVAFLLRALGAHVTLAGVVGDDSAGRTLQKLIHDAGIDGRLVTFDPLRPTTAKERFVGRTADRSARSGHQMLRVDSETREPISQELESQFTTDLMECLFEHDALLISDYAKGACTHRLLATLIAGARMATIPSLVDPARTGDFDRYHRATLVKPNRFEAELATGRKIRTVHDAFIVGQRLCRQHELGATLITLDRDGMALIEDDDSHDHVPTQPREVYDVTGAGDMVLAALGICLAAELPLRDSIRIANIAAGLEIERIGVAPVSREEVLSALSQGSQVVSQGSGGAEIQNPISASPHLRLGGPEGAYSSPADDPKIRTHDPRPLAPSSKLATILDLTDLANKYRDSQTSIVFTNGCFDLLHVGHVACLEEAAALGDVLIVAVNSDASVRALKGEGRPVVSQRERAAMLAALACVDHVVVYDEPTPHNLLEQIRPDFLVKGGTTGEIIGREIVESYGGRAVRVSEHPGISTTNSIARIQAAAALREGAWGLQKGSEAGGQGSGNTEIQNPNSEIHSPRTSLPLRKGGPGGSLSLPPDSNATPAATIAN